MKFGSWGGIQEVEIDIGKIVPDCEIKDPVKLLQRILVKPYNKTGIDMNTCTVDLAYSFLINGTLLVVMFVRGIETFRIQ